MSIVEKAHRTTVAAGLLGLGIFVGMVAVRPGPVAADDAGLAAQVAALAQRIDALEAAKDKPQTLKAPFSVVDGAGKEVLHVDSQGGRGILALLGSPGSIWLRAGDDLSIEAANSTGSASIAIDGEGASFKVGDTAGSVMIGTKGGSPTIAALQGSEEVLGFAAGGSGPQLAVKKGDKSVALSAQAGNSGLLAKNADREYQVGDIENIRGFAAYKSRIPLGGIGAIESDKFRVVIYNGKTPVFLGGYDPKGRLGLFLSDEGGTQLASVEASDAGGQLRMKGRGSKDIALLGAPDDGSDGGALSLMQGSNKVSLGYGGNGGAGPSLVFTDGSEESFAVKKDGDGAKLSLGKGDRKVVMRTSGGESIFQAYSGSRTTQMGIGKKSAGFVIGDDAKPLAALADNLDGKPFLGIYGSGSSNAMLSAGYQSNGRLAFRVGEPSKPMALLEQSETSAGELNLYGPNGGRSAISIGVAAGGTAGVRIYESGGDHQAVAMAALPGGSGAVRVYKDGVAAAGMDGQDEGGTVFVSSGGRQRAVMKELDGAGAVAIFGQGSNSLIRLVSNGIGGSMIVSDSGGNDVLEARSDASVGGIVCVNYKNVEKCLGRGLTGMEGFH